MKSLLMGLMILTSNAFATEITTNSLYTYDCTIVAEELTSHVFVKEFSLAQEFKKGIIINSQDRLLKTDNIVNGQNLYDGSINSFQVPGISIAVSKILNTGVGSGKVSLIYEGKTIPYNCSLDWSPY